MTTKWAHLLNAKHIDRILADIKDNQEAWDAARDAVWDAARYAARDAARDAAWDAARYAARYAARDAILALIAWDHSSKYLSMKPDELKVWYHLSDDPACILLLPAVIRFVQNDCLSPLEAV